MNIIVHVHRAPGHHEFFVPARRLACRGVVRPGGDAGPEGDGGDRSQHLGWDRAGAFAGEGSGGAVDPRLPARSAGCAAGAGLPLGSGGLGAAVPVAHAGERSSGKGGMRPVLGGFGGVCRGVGGGAVRCAGGWGGKPSLHPATLPRGLRRSLLCRPDLAPPTRRCRAAAADRRHRATGENPNDRYRRRAVPRAGAPHPAGRADLHSRKYRHRRDRVQARTLGRPRAETAGGNGAAVRRLPRSLGPNRGNRRSLPFFSGRTALPIPARSPFSWIDGATNAGTADVGGGGEALCRRPPRCRRRATEPRVKADRRAGVCTVFPDGR